MAFFSSSNRVSQYETAKQNRGKRGERRSAIYPRSTNELSALSAGEKSGGKTEGKLCTLKRRIDHSESGHGIDRSSQMGRGYTRYHAFFLRSCTHTWKVFPFLFFVPNQSGRLATLHRGFFSAGKVLRIPGFSPKRKGEKNPTVVFAFHRRWKKKEKPDRGFLAIKPTRRQDTARVNRGFKLRSGVSRNLMPDSRD